MNTAIDTYSNISFRYTIHMHSFYCIMMVLWWMCSHFISIHNIPKQWYNQRLPLFLDVKLNMNHIRGLRITVQTDYIKPFFQILHFAINILTSSLHTQNPAHSVIVGMS